jgi:hypothetical protein
MGLGKIDKLHLPHMNLHKTNTKWLMHNWSTFGAKTSHGQLGLIRLDPDLGETTTFPLIAYFAPLYGGHIQMAFCPRDSQVGVLKFPTLGLWPLWEPITVCADLLLQ